jgi:putative N6-adenine-specific DNA methylase
MKRFFVGCNIHFESDLEAELREIWPLLIGVDGRPQAEPLQILEQVPGGLLIEAPLHVGLQINFFSKLANRVLLRLHESRVRDFPKLFQILKELKKSPFLQGLELGSEITAKESRLNNEKRIEEIITELFGEHPDSNQRLFIRMNNDECSISLDSSGIHLHKRSERTEQGEAPLRETLAAYAVRKLIGDRSAAEILGVDLIDPMCGTGTLLREASTLYHPTLRDDFSFLAWPQVPKLLKSSSLRGNYPKIPFLFDNLKGFDIDPAAIELAKKSLAAVGRPFSVQTQNLFEAQPLAGVGRTWVISNPPYGERLKATFTPEELLERIDEVYQPERVALVLGENQSRQIKKAPVRGLRLEEQFPFQNGGLRVALSVFSR